MTIEELKQVLEAATPGPWRVVIDDDGNPLSGRPSVMSSEEYDCCIIHWDGFVQEYFRSARGDKEIHANARLIVEAVNNLPALLKVAEAARALQRSVTFPQQEHWQGKLRKALEELNDA